MKRKGRRLLEELVELIPKTLTLGLRRLSMEMELILAPDASAWEWDGRVLKEVTPMVW